MKMPDAIKKLQERKIFRIDSLIQSEYERLEENEIFKIN